MVNYSQSRTVHILTITKTALAGSLVKLGLFPPAAGCRRPERGLQLLGEAHRFEQSGGFVDGL